MALVFEKYLDKKYKPSSTYILFYDIYQMYSRSGILNYFIDT